MRASGRGEDPAAKSESPFVRRAGRDGRPAGALLIGAELQGPDGQKKKEESYSYP